MTKTALQKQLRELALKYNQKDFILRDPVQFPHRYQEKKDVEISAFITSWFSWGNRRQIIRTAEMLDSDIFKHAPYAYLQSRKWAEYQGDTGCFYRTLKWNDFFCMMQRLYEIYSRFKDLEAAVIDQMKDSSNPALALSRLFYGINGVADAQKSSPCKRLWFFLRWMVRRDGIVDFGLWQEISPTLLLIPLDTHVHKTALSLGITSRRQANIRTAQEITAFMREIFPQDPALGDFALFGLGIEHTALEPKKFI